MFAAFADNSIRQYECSADAFDPGKIDELEETASTTLAGVNRMVYSGTDTTFDMRIYAQAGESNLYVHTPRFRKIEKYSAETDFSDFIMYVDHYENEAGDEPADA